MNMNFIFYVYWWKCPHRKRSLDKELDEPEPYLHVYWWRDIHKNQAVSNSEHNMNHTVLQWEEILGKDESKLELDEPELNFMSTDEKISNDLAVLNSKFVMNHTSL